MTVVIDGTTGIDTIQDGAVATADIANGAVTGAKLSGAQTGSAPIYGCRAWCNFTGLTGVINAGGNIASVVNTGTGTYTVTMASAMQDTNYCVQVSSNILMDFAIVSTTIFTVRSYNDAGTSANCTAGSIAVFR